MSNVKHCKDCGAAVYIVRRTVDAMTSPPPVYIEVTFQICPRCDRMACPKCNFVDMSGRAVDCPRTGCKGKFKKLPS